MHALHGMWDPCICSVSIELAGGGALAGRCRTAAPDRRGPACRRAPRSGVNAAAPRVSVVPLSRARNACRRTEPCVRGRRRPAWHCLPSHSHVRVQKRAAGTAARAVTQYGATSTAQRDMSHAGPAMGMRHVMRAVVPTATIYDLDRVASDLVSQNSLVLFD